MPILSESFFILTCVGLWRPLKWKHRTSKLYYIYTFFVIYISTTFIISESIELIFFNRGIFDFFNNSSMLITVIGMCGKIFTIVYNRKMINEVIHDLEDIASQPRDAEEKKILSEFNKTNRLMNQIDKYESVRFYTLCYIVFFELSVSIFVIGKIFEDRPIGVLPFRAWLPYNYSSLISYWLTSSQQLITIFMSANVDIAHDTLFPGMLLQICAQLNILKHRFNTMLSTLKKTDSHNRIKQDETLKVTEKKLFADCVEHHVTILRLIDDVISIFSKMIFIQYSCSSIILCSSVYALSQMKPFSPEFIACASYILCMFFQIFYICLSGNRVTLEFSELSAAMYNTNWYTLTNNGRKNMFMMMMRSLKPIVIASGHFVTLSLESFKNLLKLSYTIYNVFQQSS